MDGLPDQSSRISIDTGRPWPDTLKVQWWRFSSGRLSANDDEVDRKPHFTLLLFVNCLDLVLAIKVRILTVRISLFLASCSKLTQKYMNN